MMDLGDNPVTLIVKAPNQRIADQTVDCFLEWTVRKLKEHLENVYPSNPVSIDPHKTLYINVSVCYHLGIVYCNG